MTKQSKPNYALLACQELLDDDPTLHVIRAQILPRVLRASRARTLTILAEGYQALGTQGLYPQHYHAGGPSSHWTWWDELGLPEDPHDLPGDWWALLAWDWFADGGTATTNRPNRDYQSRRQAEDAAALAFTKLPRQRRTALLAARIVMV